MCSDKVREEEGNASKVINGNRNQKEKRMFLLSPNISILLYNVADQLTDCALKQMNCFTTTAQQYQQFRCLKEHASPIQ